VKYFFHVFFPPLLKSGHGLLSYRFI
jgi:hypothetical protein